MRGSCRSATRRSSGSAPTRPGSSRRKLGWNEPITGLVAAAAVAALGGAISGWFILRTRGLTLLMLTLATTIMLKEIANEWESVTGGDNGLQNISIDPILGQFDFDLYGQTAFLYSLAVLFVLFLFARALIHSPFGHSLRGIRENQLRMPAIGAPVPRQLLAIYTVSAAMAGVAGALLAQTTEFVALQTLSFERSGDVLVILILGGTGRLYGAFLGSVVYMVLQDQLAKQVADLLAVRARADAGAGGAVRPRRALGLCEERVAPHRAAQR